MLVIGTHCILPLVRLLVELGIERYQQCGIEEGKLKWRNLEGKQVGKTLHCL